MWEVGKVCNSELPGVPWSVPVAGTELVAPAPLGGELPVPAAGCAECALEQRHVHSTDNGIKREISLLSFLLLIFILIIH